MSRERVNGADVAADGDRLAGEDTAAVDTTGTILRRLLSNLGLMAQAYVEAGARDLRLAVRDVIMATVMLGTVMMLGLYLIGLVVTAAVLAVALVLPGWAAALIVFGAVTLMTGLLVIITVAKLRRLFGRMRTTMQSAKEDLRWFRTRILRID
ncbi:MAG TPA: phage holin family protein [bacterium]|nr:phage holin family protein [bacterium]